MTDARSITAALGGKWHGRYGLARCPAHDDRTPSLSLSDGIDGRLLAHCKAGCGFTDVLDALRRRGMANGAGGISPPDAATQAQRRAEDEAQAVKRERQALTCWQDAHPVHGTLAETYLQGRGVSCPLPDSLRFHPDCWHLSGKRFPAMIARVDRVHRFAVHRTYLRPDGMGKAAVTPAKTMLGQVMGGAVCVSQEQGPLVVAEGIETALSLACGLLRSPATIWAALSAPGVAGLHLPDAPGPLIIAPDGDKAGQEAAHRLASRATGLGWQVSLLPAPQGYDWNDILTKKGAAS